jgi:hypothetical protein
MGAADDGFAEFLRQARNDPAVLGVVLTASRAMGLATEHSDYDVRTILRDDADAAALARYGETSFPGVDGGGGTLTDFVSWAAWGTEGAWDRYSFTRAQVLHDPTGVIAPLVAEKGRIAEEHRQSFVRGALDAFINSVYRSLKCSRRGDTVCARLEAADAVRHGLAVAFAIEGRISPYAVYLEYELREHPLQTFPLDADALLALIAAIVERGEVAALQRLCAAVLTHARQAGRGDIIDSWGDDIAWMTTYQPA